MRKTEAGYRFPAPPATKYNFISLGAGVQSSTMSLMAAHGIITPMPDAAIFADTQAEPASVYRWLEWLENQLPFPVYRVTAGALGEATLRMRKTKDGRIFSKTNIPFFTLNARGEQGKITHRNCTIDYKIKPLTRLQRKLAAIRRGQRDKTVTVWLGISRDEIQRMKENREPWAQNRFPLIEMNMKRGDCLLWMEARGYPRPPRSSCVFCPFHNNTEWRRLKNEEPEEFARAAAFEKAVQDAKNRGSNFDSTPFLHRSCVPLEDVDLRTDDERGQLLFGFNNECEGMCGL